MVNIFNKIKSLNKKVIVLIVLILVLILIAIFSFLYFRVPAISDFFDLYLFRKKVLENDLPYIATESPYVYAFNHNVLEQNENTLTFYNKNGVKETSLDIKIVNPIVHMNGNYFVIAEKNGQKMYLISNKNIVWEKEIEGNISNIYVNKNGYVAVSVSGTTYKTIVNLYSQDGSELFKSYSANTHIVDIAISPDNKYLALAESNLSGAIIESSVKILDINNVVTKKGESTYYKSEIPSNDLIINIDYTKTNTLSCIYDSHIDTIIDNNLKEVNNMSSNNILFADLNNRIIQIEKKSEGMFSSSYELQIINTDIEPFETKYYTLDKEPKSIKVFKNVIAVNLGREALFLNNNTWLIKQYTSSQEIRDISVSNDLAIILYKNKVEIISL